MQLQSAPLSRQNLRSYAYQIRKSLRLEKETWFPVEKFLEHFEVLSGLDTFCFTVEEDYLFPPDVHAEYISSECCIRIRESVYDGACAGNGRDRMTIAHELGHVLLVSISGISLQRNFSSQAVPAYCDPEWQAKCFAAELLIPYDLTAKMNSLEIAQYCGVSNEAARYQLSKR